MKNNNVPQRSTQRSRVPQRHERKSKQAGTHAGATTSAAGSSREKEVGAHVPQRPQRLQPQQNVDELKRDEFVNPLP